MTWRLKNFPQNWLYKDTDRFLQLKDVPGSYLGQAGKTVAVNGAETALEFVNNVATDEKVKITAADTTAGYLESKVLAGTGITVTKENAGGNEDLKIATTVTQYTDEMAQDAVGAMIGDSLQYVDGTPLLDTIQDIQTTATPQFARLGLGQAADAALALAITGNQTILNTITTSGVANNDRLFQASATFSSGGSSARYPRGLFAQIDTGGSTNFGAGSTIVGLQGQARHIAAITVPSIIGLYGRAGGWNATTATETIGLQGVVQSGIYGGGSSSSPNYTTTTAVSVDANLTIFNNGTLTATNAYLFRGSLSKPGTGVSAIATMYGLYLPDITYGTSANYGIYSAGGANYFGGAMTLNSDLTVNGNTILGNASTDTITCIGRFIPRTVGADPTSSATAGSLGEIVFYNDKWYGKTVASGTDTNWSALN